MDFVHNESLNDVHSRPNSSAHGLESLATIYSWLVPILCTFLLVAAICNALILLSVPWIQKKRSPYLRVCLSLSAADTCTAVLLLLGLLLNSYLPVVLDVTISALFSCVALIFEILRLSLLLVSDLHLLALALIHCFSLLFPLQFKVKMTGRLTMRFILSLWCIPCLVLLPSFAVFSDERLLSIVTTCRIPFYNMFPFRLFVFIVFLLPLLLSFVIYVVIFVALSHKRRANLNETLSTNVAGSTGQRSGSDLNRKKLGLTTALITGTFVIGWFPLIFWFTLACVQGCYYSLQDFSPLTLAAIGGAVNALVILKLLLNPLIYALRSEAIQNAIGSMWTNRLRGPNNANWAAVRPPETPVGSRVLTLSGMGVWQKRSSARSLADADGAERLPLLKVMLKRRAHLHGTSPQEMNSPCTTSSVARM